MVHRQLNLLIIYLKECDVLHNVICIHYSGWLGVLLVATNSASEGLHRQSSMPKWYFFSWHLWKSIAIHAILFKKSCCGPSGIVMGNIGLATRKHLSGFKITWNP